MRAWGTCLFPSARHRRVPTWNTVSRFGLPWADNKMWSTNWRESSRRPGGWPRLGEHQVQGEAEGIELFQPGEEKLSSCSTSVSEVDCREDGPLFRYVQRIEKMQCLHVAGRDTPVGICHAVRAPADMVQRFWNPHLWKLSRFDSMRPCATWTNFEVVHAFSGVLEWMTSRGHFQHTFLWFCGSAESVWSCFLADCPNILKVWGFDCGGSESYSHSFFFF